jgi:hypothetical protein
MNKYSWEVIFITSKKTYHTNNYITGIIIYSSVFSIKNSNR